MANFYDNLFPPLPLVTHAKSRSVSAENPQGKPGEGGQAASNLGPGRKGRPCLDLPKGEAFTLLDAEGPGIVRSIWFTLADRTPEGPFVLRNLVLRMYWDGEQTPSVETPLGDFFCCGFGEFCQVNSQYICVNPAWGLNCYFPMPFRKHARIEILNEHPSAVGLFYQINYEMLDIPEGFGYFHAQWRRTNGAGKGADHVILDGVSGAGQYVGTYVAWAALERYWWGEGEIKFFIDGNDEYPTICGTGTEDYFNGAWCFYKKKDGVLAEDTFCTPYVGYPFNSALDNTMSHMFSKDDVPMHGLYRWHAPDPVRFGSKLRVTIQQMGYNGRELFERSDDVSSVAYWYQTEPHGAFPALPGTEQRRPR
jgi:hypothetical protein